MTIEIGTGSADPVLAPIILDIGVTVTVTLAEVALDPFTDPNVTAHHTIEAQAHTVTDETLHTADPHHAGASPEITVDPGHTSRKHHHKTSTRPSSSSDQTPWKTKDRKYKQVTIDDPPSQYYSSDEQDSDSEDDLN